MIVADTNLIAYLHLAGAQTDAAETALLADPDWHAPLLWRSEFRNVLALQVRHRGMGTGDAGRVAAEAEKTMEGREHLVRSPPVLQLAEASGRTAYDCEFVALAEALGVRLVTADTELVESFPDRATSLEVFAG